MEQYIEEKGKKKKEDKIQYSLVSCLILKILK